MLPHLPGKEHFLPGTSQSSQNLQPSSSVPWWDDISPEVVRELALSPVTSWEPQRVDIAVVGAGVAGLSAAVNASVAGARVLVLEHAHTCGYGATGRNAGILSAGVNMSLAELSDDSPAVAFWPETTLVLRQLVEEAAQPGALLSASLTGSLSLAESASALRRLKRDAQRRVAIGLRAEMWSLEQVVAVTEGRLDLAGVQGALWLPDEGRIQPLTLLAHLAKRARQQGVTLLGEAQVVDTEEVSNDGERFWRILLANGMSIQAGGLIIGTGPTAQPGARIYAMAFPIDLPAHFPLFWNAAPYVYTDFRPGNGRLGVSGGLYGHAGKTERDEQYFQRMLQETRSWVPELAQQAPSHCWAVDLDVAADMIPHLNWRDTKTPAVAIEGLGALGVLPGIVLGQRAGEQMNKILQ